MMKRRLTTQAEETQVVAARLLMITALSPTSGRTSGGRSSCCIAAEIPSSDLKKTCHHSRRPHGLWPFSRLLRHRIRSLAETVQARPAATTQGG